MTVLALFRTRRFWPLFATQALGAFNDNLLRSAMLFLIAFRLTGGDAGAGARAASITGGVFVLPFFLFSAPAGQLADRIDKARVVRIVKLAELAIMGIATAGLLLPSVALLYVALFAMGCHSTLFGPVKYAVLPHYLRRHELIAGTALIEAATFLAILAGQIAGGLLPIGWAAAALVAASLGGIATSRRLPPAPPAPGAPRVDRNLARGTVRILRVVRADRTLGRAILGISWFFALGAVLTQQFVPLVAGLNAAPRVAALLLALFSVGVALGALAAMRLARRPARAVFPAALALAGLMAELAWSTATLRPAFGSPVGIAGFLALPGGPRLVCDVVALAAAGGLYVVPLYILLQTASDPAGRAGAIAANNIVNAGAMVGVTILSLGMLRAGAGVPGLFAALAALGLAAAWSARRLATTDQPFQP